MCFSKPITSLLLLTCFLFLHAVLGFVPTHECLGFKKFNIKDPYETNLNELMNNLTKETPPTGFGLGSKGQGQDTTYGLALCFGYISPKDCMSCLTNARNEIHPLCPYSKGAVVWYSFCLLKYSNENFFGQIDKQIHSRITENENVSDPVSFSQKTNSFLMQLANNASVAPKMQAERSISFGEKDVIDMIAACTRDLSSVDCAECLRNCIAEFPKCCAGKKGAYCYSASCVAGYELIIF
ncbi:Cysteine-rich repeat secretory protein 38 [Morella rubra]|uniref:Cysteine-rich repeat secretory protein 38 n=1 Tax=Morella rubra TaxID=262757 RepID=A0A6A1WU79_9ROSI|nr:Cysteine-rich repeat secretory protein 38 [Morella rubra]